MHILSSPALLRAFHALFLFFVLYGHCLEANTSSQLIASVKGGHSLYELSPGGRYLVYLSRDNNIATLWSVDTKGQKTPIKLSPSGLKNSDTIGRFVISPNGQSVAYTAVIHGTSKSQRLFSARLDGSTPPLQLAEAEIRPDLSPERFPQDFRMDHVPFDFRFKFSDDSQYLLYTIPYNAVFNTLTNKAIRVHTEDPQQVVEMTQALVGKAEFQRIAEYGFIPGSHDVYLLTNKNENSKDDPQTFIIHTNIESIPKLGFSVTDHNHHFLDDGKHLLLSSLDHAGIRQLFIYHWPTGIRTRLSTSKLHNNALFLQNFNQLELQVYGDQVLYYPQGLAKVAFGSQLLSRPCFLTHLKYSERDRKISDNCNNAKLLLAEDRIIYDTFTYESLIPGLPQTGAYNLMTQSLEKGDSIRLLAEGHWRSGFQTPRISAYQTVADGQWATFNDVLSADSSQTIWLNLHNTEESLNWIASAQGPLFLAFSPNGAYQPFSNNGTRILTDEDNSSVPTAIKQHYDPLSIPDLESGSNSQTIHIPMADNCRVFSRSNLNPPKQNEFLNYYMSDCDRPWTELWWNPEYAGQGLRVQQIGDRVFAAWFAYDAQGQAAWVTLSGQLENNELKGELKQFTGPALGSPWDSGQVQSITVGNATLKLHPDRVSASFDYTVGEIRGHLDLQPFYQGPANQYDGFWWQKKTSGQGVQIYHKEDQLFGCIYLYDETGQSFWVTFQGKRVGNLFTARLKRFTGPHLGDAWNINQVRAEEVGDITLQLIGANRDRSNPNARLYGESSPSFIAMDYTINGKTMHLDLEPFRF